MTLDPVFSKFRLRFFPIYNAELPKFLSLALMHIFIIMNFWLIHNMKDTLIIMTPESGAETINFIKTWAVFPISIGFIIIYAWLSNSISQRTLFCSILALFVLFYAAFAFILYPSREALHMPVERIIALKAAYPHFKWFFPMVGYWIYTLFYVFGDMWSAVVLNVLFWQFANQVTPVDQAKRFYMMFGAASAFGIIAAGSATHFFHKFFPVWGDIVSGTTYLIVLNSVVIVGIYLWTNHSIVYVPEHPTSPKNKIKLSLLNSFKHIFRSSYLMYIALISIGYNVVLNLIEITWKSQLKLLYKSEHSFFQFMGEFNFLLGIIVFITSLVGVNVVRTFSWKSSALVTPLLILLTGAPFFFLTVFGDKIFSYFLIGVSPVIVSCWMGLIQTLTARSTKYSFFNTTREMAYIPLDPELKVKGKAAVDVLSTRVGKMGGATIQQVLLIALGSAGEQILIAPYLGVIMIGIIGLWMMAVSALNQKFLAIQKKS